MINWITTQKEITSNPQIEPLAIQPIFRETLRRTAFLEFLRSKSCVEFTNHYIVSTPVKTRSINASFSLNETASDVTVADPTWTNLPKKMSVAAKRISATCLAIEGNTFINPLNDELSRNMEDIMTAVDQRIISPLADDVTGSVDNIPHHCGQIIDLDTTLTLDSLQDGVDSYYLRNGFFPDFILITSHWMRNVIWSDTKRVKRLSTNTNQNKLGDWLFYYQDMEGPIPFIIDDNMTYRLNPVLGVVDQCILGHSKALRLWFMNNGWKKNIHSRDFRYDVLFGLPCAFSVIDTDPFLKLSEPFPDVYLPKQDQYVFDIESEVNYHVDNLNEFDWVVEDA